MISKFKYVVFGISICFYSCILNKPINKQVLIDMNGRQICHSFMDNDSNIYYQEDGSQIIACFGGVDFEGGKDSLSTYLLTKYINHVSYNHEEYNLYEYFFILFNKNLDIKEIRIMYRKYDNNKRFYYDNIFVDAIKSTSGMWHKIVENKEYYVYIHRQKIY